jgi:hypothetical protein
MLSDHCASLFPAVATGGVQSSLKTRKTSEFVPQRPSILKSEVDLKFRKTSAMVLMPSNPKSLSLNVDKSHLDDFKPMKNSGFADNYQAEMPKLRSALKMSSINAPKIQIAENNNNNNNDNRRGSVGLGRSKSVCHKVKFVPTIVRESVDDENNEDNNNNDGKKKTFISFLVKLLGIFNLKAALINSNSLLDTLRYGPRFHGIYTSFKKKIPKKIP